MAVNNKTLTPRQKMINVMYIVLLAMLALNVSSDVLEAFSQVDDSLKRTAEGSMKQNELLFADLTEHMRTNPEKVGAWFKKAERVKLLSDSLYNYAQELKVRIVQQSEGKKGDVNNIINKDDLEAAASVMLASGKGHGKKLLESINAYREEMLSMVESTTQRDIIRQNLSTEVPPKESAMGKNWQEYIFENTPVVAAVTLLSKLQSDIRYAEGEVLHTLVKYVDVRDLRVNQLNAFVIPNSRHVVRGGKFSAQIVLAAVDSTQRPVIYIDDKPLPANNNGLYEMVCNSTGEFTLKGHLELGGANGEVFKHNFSQPYTVVEPSATVSATLMNVLYAGYDNPISVSVPGVPSGSVQAVMANGNGTLQRTGNTYIAKPAKVGEDAVIRVTASVDGRTQVMGEYVYRVRQLPDPSPFIEYKDAQGAVRRYRGGTGFSKAILMNTDGIVAAVDDGLLDINFRVLSFETTFFDNMGNAVPEVSNGTNFSARQKDMFRRLSRGKRFYISRVRAIGPDGIERVLPTTLEVIVN
ncbi:gliding motility protein GldM [Bacteroides sp. 214]|uniref:type IX secretion system motor protein PorM/GldM n=1 Tax=Bacteroides sp. 214 TaxID=2302935 RepID=UPI0013D7BBA4|nr:gliding motility protein GldM [Bacteroides sp. 214]NDW13043.1 gliding motility protein GldM [Bacteroides sp. 214]